MVLPPVFFYLGRYVQDARICAKIRKASAEFIDPIGFEGDTIDHLHTLTILDDSEIRKVIETI